jgi:hypothetical protein
MDRPEPLPHRLDSYPSMAASRMAMMRGMDIGRELLETWFRKTQKSLREARRKIARAPASSHLLLAGSHLRPH